MEDHPGESIWDISSWEKDIHWKDQALRNYFDNLDFSECVKKILQLADEYFESIFKLYEYDEEGAEIQFNYLDILVFITEEYIYGHYYYGVSPAQELQLVQTVCSYFQSKPLDPVRYFVFDCMFGIPTDNLEIQRNFLDHKMDVITKLASMAVGVGCGNVLNCVAVWMHTYGSYEGRAMRLANSIVNDYCSICPKATPALKKLIDVSPVFAHQFVVSLADFHSPNTNKDGGERTTLPHSILVDIVASWIIEQPQFCSVKIPSLFLELPSIHKYDHIVADKTTPFFFCPIFKVMNWCILEPILRSEGVDDSSRGAHLKYAYSKLVFGLLNYVSLQKKVEPAPSDDPDDLEPGELLEENDFVELLSQADIMSFVMTFQRMSEEISAACEVDVEESVDRFVQLIQLCFWAGSITIQPKKLLAMLQLLPKSQLLELVTSRLKSNSVSGGTGKSKRSST